MSQGILSVYNPNNGTTGNDVSIYFFIDNNLTARRGEIEVGSNAPVGYRFMAIHLFGTTLVEVGRFSSYYNGLMLGIDTNQVFLFTGTARPKLMVGGPVGIYGARDKVDTFAYIGGNEDIDTRNHIFTKRNSGTASLNFIRRQLHNGSGNFGLTTGLMHAVSTGGLDLFGIGTDAPSYMLTVGSGSLWGVSSTGKVNYASGSNRAAGTATLSSGTITVNTTNVTANSKIKLTYQSCTNCATLYVGTITAATSFVINSTDGTDGSVVFWEIADIN